MTAAKTPGNRDTQPELVISCDLGKEIEGLNTNPAT